MRFAGVDMPSPELQKARQCAQPSVVDGGAFAWTAAVGQPALPGEHAAQKPATEAGDIVDDGEVVIVDENTDAEQKLQIVGHYESNADKGLISLQAPMARALIGKSKGDSAEVRTPQGVKSYEILEVVYE